MSKKFQILLELMKLWKVYWWRYIIYTDIHTICSGRRGVMFILFKIFHVNFFFIQYHVFFIPIYPMSMEDKWTYITLTHTSMYIHTHICMHIKTLLIIIFVFDSSVNLQTYTTKMNLWIKFNIIIWFLSLDCQKCSSCMF